MSLCLLFLYVCERCHVFTSLCVLIDFYVATEDRSRDRLVVRTLRCGRNNPGSNPDHGKRLFFFFFVPPSPFSLTIHHQSPQENNFSFFHQRITVRRPQVLAGDLDEAICTHALYYSIWRRYEAMPERFSWNNKSPNVNFYPLRPELVESTYLLYQVSICQQPLPFLCTNSE